MGRNNTMSTAAIAGDDVRETLQRHKSTIGANLRRLRLTRDMSQSDVARAIGVESPTISRIESGKAIPSGHTMAKLEVLFVIPPGSLYRPAQFTEDYSAA